MATDVRPLRGTRILISVVSRAAKELDGELEAWRTRELGAITYLILDARYEKVRHGGTVVDCAILTAIGVLPDGKRSVLGTSCSLSEAEVHWRAFLESLIERGMHGVRMIVSDDHAGIRAARKALFPSVPWQRCQFHLAQNAMGQGKAGDGFIAAMTGSRLDLTLNADGSYVIEALLPEPEGEKKHTRQSGA